MKASCRCLRRHGPRQGAPGIGEPAGKAADNGIVLRFPTVARHEVAIIQDRTEAAETDAAAERPDGCLRTAPDDPRPARTLSVAGPASGRRNFRRRPQKTNAGSKPPAAGRRSPVQFRFGPGAGIHPAAPATAFARFDMTAGIRRKPTVCKDSGGNRAARSGRNGLFVSSILNGVNRLFDRLKTPAARRAGPERRRSPVAPACRREAASWRRACHAA